MVFSTSEGSLRLLKSTPVSYTHLDSYGLPIEAITVLVQDYPKESIGVAGELLSDRK